MIKIYCRKEDAKKLSKCLKQGACPKDAYANEKFCVEKCYYNIENVEIEKTKDEQICIEGIEDIEDNLKICIYNTFYNYLACGMVDNGENCDNCRFYNDNIKKNYL